MGGLADEVVGPDVVGMLWSQADAGAVGEPETASLRLPRRHLEALGAPDALYSLGVHGPAGHLQQVGDAPVTVAAEAARQGDDRRRERVFVVSALRTVPLGRAILAERLTGPALGDVQPLTDCFYAVAST